MKLREEIDVKMGVIIQVRIDHEELDLLEKWGLRPGPFMRDLLRKEIARRRSMEDDD